MPPVHHEVMNRTDLDAYVTHGHPGTPESDRPVHGPAPVRTLVVRNGVDRRPLLTLLAGTVTVLVLFAALSAGRAQEVAQGAAHVGAADAAAGAARAAITVTGTGTAYGTPDLAVIEVGVSVYGADVRTALAEADASMSAVREAVVAAGVAAEDIRTTSLNVWRDERTNQDGEIVIDRYQVSHSYQVQVRSVDAVGEVLAAAVDAGANYIGGITFTIADPQALANEARALAFADAATKAGQLADLAGVSLGTITDISELGSGSNGAYPAGARYDTAAVSPVEGGQLAVSITLSVAYAID